MADADVDDDPVVANPTYMEHVRFFFRQMDADHMRSQGIELGTYAGVKKNASRIFTHTAPPRATMPPKAADKWSANRSATFQNWINNKCPVGSATPRAAEDLRLATASADRVRKNVATLGADEIETLKAAFTGLMARDPKQDDSYFALAGPHGLPQRWCCHHEDRYNPWHREFLRLFEDALRSVPGCEQVTIPYWDISTPLPALLQEPPFDSYKLPLDPGIAADPAVPGEYFPYTTSRFAAKDIESELARHGVLDEIDKSLKTSRWGFTNFSGYQLYSIQAHDGGHGSIGETMGEQDVAAYDPIFWFFHCNLDRLWLTWQHNVQATTLAGFISTIDNDPVWLSKPIGMLDPWTTEAKETITFSIGYDELALPSDEEVTLENTLGSVEASRSFSIKASTPVSVRVKGIDRMSIPGSFAVNLLADGEEIARRFFFQPSSPRLCENCKKLPLVNIDFLIEQEKLLDRTLTITIEVPKLKDVGPTFPLSQAGNPTINARLLLEDE